MPETCRWCGDRHGVDQLCQRAQRGMTRRSFCFLFGAGVAGALVAGSAPVKNDFFCEATVFDLRRLDAEHEAYFQNVVKPLLTEMERQIGEQLGIDPRLISRLVTAQKSLQRS